MRQKLGKLQMGKGASRWRMIRDVMEDTNLHGRVISFDSLHTTHVSPTDREIPDTSLMIHTMMQGPRLTPKGDQSPSMRHTSFALRNLLEISREATIVEPPVRGMMHHTTGEIAHNNSPSSPRGRERHRREETNSSKGLRNTDERGNPLLLDQQSVPHEAFNEALEEVREVMVQHTQCADPTESAARKERLRKAEKEGQLEETATRMVQASLADKPEEQQQLEEVPSIERVPIALRLGPIAPFLSPVDGVGTGTTEKCKPGRPPGRRTIQSSPKLIRGSSSRKRKLQQPKTTQSRHQPQQPIQRINQFAT
ncbi:hypothetical protein DY000_02052093 [Brassica cretica]|uniref:Uncharacterized protein n=1 Tax=Brassica cretica TaxID=69181 RepID=A0ABQ7ADT9_BRACR|nr:hypothetical protein DY000_02052093 [Brassica cretica]